MGITCSPNPNDSAVIDTISISCNKNVTIIGYYVVNVTTSDNAIDITTICCAINITII